MLAVIEGFHRTTDSMVFLYTFPDQVSHLLAAIRISSSITCWDTPLVALTYTVCRMLGVKPKERNQGSTVYIYATHYQPLFQL